MFQTWPDDGSYGRMLDEERRIQHMKEQLLWNRGQFLDYVEAYINSALWTYSGGKVEREALSFDAYERMYRDCLDFYTASQVEVYEWSPNRVGHDFWMTRNGEGCGFWDGDWTEPLASQLTERSKSFGECTLYTGDDGRIHVA